MYPSRTWTPSWLCHVQSQHYWSSVAQQKCLTFHKLTVLLNHLLCIVMLVLQWSSGPAKLSLQLVLKCSWRLLFSSRSLTNSYLLACIWNAQNWHLRNTDHLRGMFWQNCPSQSFNAWTVLRQFETLHKPHCSASGTLLATVKMTAEACKQGNLALSQCCKTKGMHRLCWNGDLLLLAFQASMKLTVMHKLPMIDHFFWFGLILSNQWWLLVCLMQNMLVSMAFLSNMVHWYAPSCQPWQPVCSMGLPIHAGCQSCPSVWIKMQIYSLDAGHHLCLLYPLTYYSLRHIYKHHSTTGKCADRFLWNSALLYT